MNETTQNGILSRENLNGSPCTGSLRTSEYDATVQYKTLGQISPVFSDTEMGNEFFLFLGSLEDSSKDHAIDLNNIWKGIIPYRQTVTVLKFNATEINRSEKEIQSRREELCRGLLRYVNLPNDWDGDDGYAPARQDIENAIKFMEFIPVKGIFSAELMVAGDGDVGFKWETKDAYIEVGFCHGDISFYGTTVIGDKVKGDERFNGTIPEKLAELMNIVFSG